MRVWREADEHLNSGTWDVCDECLGREIDWKVWLGDSLGTCERCDVRVDGDGLTVVPYGCLFVTNGERL